jgi:hypothetical protein
MAANRFTALLDLCRLADRSGLFRQLDEQSRQNILLALEEESEAELESSRAEGEAFWAWYESQTNNVFQAQVRCQVSKVLKSVGGLRLHWIMKKYPDADASVLAHHVETEIYQAAGLIDRDAAGFRLMIERRRAFLDNLAAPEKQAVIYELDRQAEKYGDAAPPLSDKIMRGANVRTLPKKSLTPIDI